MLKIYQLPVLTDNYIYLLHDTDSNQTAVVDPAIAQPVLDKLESLNLSLNYILNTHHHNDHVGGNITLKNGKRELTAEQTKVILTKQAKELGMTLEEYEKLLINQ